MNKIWLVIQREYFTRVRKKSFIIMTLLGPILVALFYAGLIFVAVSDEEKPHTVMVIDESATLIGDKLRTYSARYPDSKLKFVWKYSSFEEAKEHIYEEDYDAILRFPENPVGHPNLIFYRVKEHPSLNIKSTLETEVEKLIEEEKLKSYNIDKKVFDEIRQKIHLPSKKIKADGSEEEDIYEVRFLIGLIAGLVIYMFIFMYGVQVLRGVMEEKTNRIVEVIASSVKPFQLMMGKIIGIALVGLTQFMIWVIFSGIIMTVISTVFAPGVMDQINQGTLQTQGEVGGMDVTLFLSAVMNLPFGYILFAFVFYFLAGYLLYASLFAAVGSAVDSETDTQQFMLPITLPLAFSIGLAMNALQNPDGTIARIFSMFPLTSPVVMMVRIPFKIDAGDLAISMSLLVLGFVFTTWLAAKIYRTGILMYGKKVTYKELWKWLFYKG